MLFQIILWTTLYTSWPIIVSYLIAIGLMRSEKLHWKLLYCYIQISCQIWKLSDQWLQWSRIHKVKWDRRMNKWTNWKMIPPPPPYYCRKCIITLVANEPSNNNSAVGNCRVPSLSFNFTICILLREPSSFLVSK